MINDKNEARYEQPRYNGLSALSQALRILISKVRSLWSWLEVRGWTYSLEDNPMSVTLLARHTEKDEQNLESQFENKQHNIYANLEAAFNKETQRDDWNLISGKWREITFPILSQYDSLKEKSKALSDIVPNIKKFRDSQSDRLNTDILELLKKDYLFLEAISGIFSAFSLIYEESPTENRPAKKIKNKYDLQLRKIENIYKGFKLISINTNNLLQWLSPEDFSNTYPILEKQAHLALSDNWVHKLEKDKNRSNKMTTQQLINKTRELAKAILSEIEEIKSEIELKKYLNNLPHSEPWLDRYPEAKASVERGLAQALAGEKVICLSFLNMEFED